MVREKLNVKERQLNIENENKNKFTSRYKSTQDEIKELKTKFDGNISLIEDTQTFWDEIFQEVHSIWEYIITIPQQNIMI